MFYETRFVNILRWPHQLGQRRMESDGGRFRYAGAELHCDASRIPWFHWNHRHCVVANQPLWMLVLPQARLVFLIHFSGHFRYWSSELAVFSTIRGPRNPDQRSRPDMQSSTTRVRMRLHRRR